MLNMCRESDSFIVLVDPVSVIQEGYCTATQTVYKIYLMLVHSDHHSTLMILGRNTRMLSSITARYRISGQVTSLTLFLGQYSGLPMSGICHFVVNFFCLHVSKELDFFDKHEKSFFVREILCCLT